MNISDVAPIQCILKTFALSVPVCVVEHGKLVQSNSGDDVYKTYRVNCDKGYKANAPSDNIICHCDGKMKPAVACVKCPFFYCSATTDRLFFKLLGKFACKLAGDNAGNLKKHSKKL